MWISPRSQASLLDTRAGVASHAAAKQLLIDALERYPDDAQLQLALAISIERAGDDAFAVRDLTRAQAAYRQVITRIEALLATTPASVAFKRELATVHSRLSLLLDLDGDADAAIASSAQAVAMIESLLAADPTNDALRQGAGAGLGVLAKLLIRSNRFAEAGPLIERQISINRRRAEASPENAEVLLALSLGYRRRGEQQAGLGHFDAAIEAHEQALQLQSGIAEQSADNESHRALTLLHLGRVQRLKGNRPAAIARLTEAITAMDALVVAHMEVPVYREDLIDSEEALGDTLAEATRARPHYLRAIELIDTFVTDADLAPTFAERRIALLEKSAPPTAAQ